MELQASIDALELKLDNSHRIVTRAFEKLDFLSEAHRYLKSLVVDCRVLKNNWAKCCQVKT